MKAMKQGNGLRVDGFTFDNLSGKMKVSNITVRVTHDKLGSTLSLEDGKTMISVSLKPIECMLIKKVGRR